MSAADEITIDVSKCPLHLKFTMNAQEYKFLLECISYLRGLYSFSTSKEDSRTYACLDNLYNILISPKD